MARGNDKGKLDFGTGFGNPGEAIGDSLNNLNVLSVSFETLRQKAQNALSSICQYFEGAGKCVVDFKNKVLALGEAFDALTSRQEAIVELFTNIGAAEEMSLVSKLCPGRNLIKAKG